MGMNCSELTGAEAGGGVVGADEEGAGERAEGEEEKGEGVGHGDGLCQRRRAVDWSGGDRAFGIVLRGRRGKGLEGELRMDGYIAYTGRREGNKHVCPVTFLALIFFFSFLFYLRKKKFLFILLLLFYKSFLYLLQVQKGRRPENIFFIKTDHGTGTVNIKDRL